MGILWSRKLGTNVLCLSRVPVKDSLACCIKRKDFELNSKSQTLFSVYLKYDNFYWNHVKRIALVLSGIRMYPLVLFST